MLLQQTVFCPILIPLYVKVIKCSGSAPDVHVAQLDNTKSLLMKITYENCSTIYETYIQVSYLVNRDSIVKLFHFISV